MLSRCVNTFPSSFPYVLFGISFPLSLMEYFLITTPGNWLSGTEDSTWKTWPWYWTLNSWYWEEHVNVTVWYKAMEMGSKPSIRVWQIMYQRFTKQSNFLTNIHSTTFIAIYSGTLQSWSFMLNPDVLQCDAINVTVYINTFTECLSPYI